MSRDKSEILQGTLDLMVLQTLETMGSMHGYGIGLRIEQVSRKALEVNQGTIYLCLVRLVQKGWITAEWGESENNRKAKFYSITKAGRGAGFRLRKRCGRRGCDSVARRNFGRRTGKSAACR